MCNFYTSDIYIERRNLETQLEIMKIDLKVRSEEASVKIIVDYNMVEGDKWALFSQIII